MLGFETSGFAVFVCLVSFWSGLLALRLNSRRRTRIRLGTCRSVRLRFCLLCFVGHVSRSLPFRDRGTLNSEPQTQKTLA